MEIKVRPIKGEVSGLTKIFNETVLSNLPIHKWEREQKNKRKVF